MGGLPLRYGLVLLSSLRHCRLHRHVVSQSVGQSLAARYSRALWDFHCDGAFDQSPEVLLNFSNLVFWGVVVTRCSSAAEACAVAFDSLSSVSELIVEVLLEVVFKFMSNSRARAQRLLIHAFIRVGDSVTGSEAR